LQAAVLDQNVTSGAFTADSGSTISSILSTANDEVHQLAAVAVGQVETLLAVNAAAEVVNGDASVAREAHTTVTNLVVHVGRITLRAVLIAVPGETAGLGNGLGGRESHHE